MRFQDSNTQPRQPSVAEQRARQQALAQEERDQELARQADAKAATRRKILIGSGVTVGLVGLVATFYTVARPTGDVTAVCTDGSGVIQNDDYCDESYVTSHHGYSSGGFWFIPINGGGYQSYRYNYGGTGTIGQHVTGGSYDAPSSRTSVHTKSGKSVQRGGFGISGKSGSTGGSGKSGGS
ncbi:DUF2058 domain-containing protein [Amycolatopsis sp. SID8362]|uniref:DUF2058 domain-containing protein n=1 Tax=Amycolatopsis sp. SID8362 TaxID=2690346 RepID=UPI00136A97C2|nr:DUF2058 domain-containing protein [Amycolatopsis sp. SID8362]NBH11306.1 hypothetical protein [Amycolatopsis sp. SID8362]NED47998.1 DUF2058 domain-containing protein [Amycolatopsis sp. SID8362]